jgi:hypothetical protein
VPERGERLTAGALRIRTFEGSRPEFGRAIAHWGFNRIRATKCGNCATQRLIGHIAVRPPISNIAVALPNNTTRSVRRSAASFKRAYRFLSVATWLACRHCGLLVLELVRALRGDSGSFAN